MLTFITNLALSAVAEINGLKMAIPHFDGGTIGLQWLKLCRN